MHRRDFLKVIACASFVPAFTETAGAAQLAEEAWHSLGNAVGNRLVKLDDPLAACRENPNSPACQALFKEIRNPYFISEDAALTETSGWLDAWTSRPSTYAVKVRTTDD